MFPPALTVWPLAFLCVLFAAFSEASAKTAPEKGGPPILAPVDVRVEGRKPIRIFLKAHGLQRSPMKFVIRREPEFGRLRLVKEVSGDSVEVEYVPPENALIKEDSFWFAGSNAQGFSSDVRARIQISDLGPLLQAPPLLDFETVRAGQSKPLSIEVSNVGDQRFDGGVTVSAPWELEGKVSSVALAPGEKRLIRVVFKPTKVGTTRGSVQFGGGVQTTVQLRGEGGDWVDLDRDPVSLVWADSRQQAGSLTLSNPGEEALELHIETSPALEHDRWLKLDAGAVVSLPLRWQENPVPGGWGTLLLLSQTGMRRVVVWNLDAVLSGVGTALILEGEGAFLSVRRTFTNTGGRVGTWSFRCTSPFFLGDAGVLNKEIQSPPAERAERTSDINKKGGEHAEIPGFVWDHNQNRYVPSRGSSNASGVARLVPKPTASVDPPKRRASELVRTLHPGESFDLLIVVEGRSAEMAGSLFVDGPGQRYQEPVQSPRSGRKKPSMGGRGGVAELLSEIKPSALPPLTAQEMVALPPQVGTPLPTPVAPSGLKMLPPLFSQKANAPGVASALPGDALASALLPGLFLDGLLVTDVTPDSATIRFPVPPGVQPEQIVVRHGELLEGDGSGAMDWVPFPDSQRRGKLVNGQIQIHLRGLQAGMINFIDLLGPPSSNGWRDRVFVTQIDTPPASSLLSPRGPLSWLVLSTAAVGGYFLRRRSAR